MNEGNTASWDAIVIGSGMGGMAAGAALSRLGHRVLLLEQYKTLGGLTHSFSREGFSWDVGVHYLGALAPGERERKLIDWLCHTPMDFVSLGAVYDILHIADAPPLSLSQPYEAQERDLKNRFPDEVEAIAAWTKALKAGQEVMHQIFPTRALPETASDAAMRWDDRALDKWCLRTTREVIDDLTTNPELAAVLAAQWGDHGGRPSKASFAMHALVLGSYLKCGAWYPVGGGAAFAEHLLPTIIEAGGEARANVKVDTLVFENNKVVGVRTSHGEEIRSKVVLSDIGARETVKHLLPEGRGQGGWVEEIRALPSSIAHFSLFLGFEGDIKSAGATRANHWVYPKGKVDALWTNVPQEDPPGFFVSFASLKDPSHDPGPQQKHVGELMVCTDWSSISRWAELPADERGKDYKLFKQQVEEKLLVQLRKHFPELADLLVFHELSTPLATGAITGHHEGAFYGLDVTPERTVSDALKAKTPIEGLYLTGQDVVSPGIQGALWGGVLAAASVDPRVFEQIVG